MPVNLIDIRKKLKRFTRQASTYQGDLDSRQQELMGLVHKYDDRLDELRDLVDRAAETNPRLRCAYPLTEALDEVVPMQDMPEKVAVIAADGSQINPNRHTQVPFCVINIGLVKMLCGSGERPEVIVESELLDYDDVFLPAGGMLSEGMVALKRDQKERETLVRLAGEWEAPAIAMVDGPLELIREPQTTTGFEKVLDQLRQTLTEAKAKGLALLGYIDKSQNDLIGRLLELTQYSEEQLRNAAQQNRRYVGVSDSHLLEPLLTNPGDRSAVFGIYSQTALQFQGDLALRFFYLNVGQPGRPHIARIELPAWVVEDGDLLNAVQSTLVDQAQAFGPRPYPYLLHRAHEEAIISMPEHQHVEEMIIAEFSRNGIPVEEGSNKQFIKDLGNTKTRYQG